MQTSFIEPPSSETEKGVGGWGWEQGRGRVFSNHLVCVFVFIVNLCVLVDFDSYVHVYIFVQSLELAVIWQ